MNLLAFVCASIVFAVCVVLVFHKDYEDGLIGRLALALIGIASLARIIGILESGFEVRLSPITITLWTGLAIFFGRHIYRFLRWRKDGAHDWRPANK